MGDLLSFNFFTLVYFSALVSMLAAYYEYYNIGKYVNKDYYSREYVNNSELIIDSIKCIMTQKFGELTVFAYPITLISVSIFIFLYLKTIGIHFEHGATPIFLLVSSVIVGLHIFVPYQMTYLKQAREAYSHEMSVEQWFRYAFMKVKISKPKEEIDLEGFSFIEYKANEYDIYCQDVLKIKENNPDKNIEPLTERIYYMYIPFFGKHFTFFFLDNEETRASNEKTKVILERSETVPGILTSSIFEEVNIHFLLMQRFVEIGLFFSILQILFEKRL